MAAKAAGYWPMLKQTVNEWSEDKAPKLAAALAYYTMLSIAPLLIICIKIVGVGFGAEAASGQIKNYLNSTVGAKGAQAAEEIIRNASQQGSGILATIISIIVLIFSASGVFGELQDSLNTIWEVKPKPNQGIWATLKNRFFSFTLVLGVAFLLLVSLVITTVLSGLTDKLGGAHGGIFWELLHFVISLAVVTALFAMMFRYLPDVRIKWRNVWIGAALTAVLFTTGKFLLGWYLGRASTTSVYGAAGSLVAMLIWVYYSAQILFFGAAFTQVYAHAHGDAMQPTENAMRITEQERAQQGIAHKQAKAAYASKTETVSHRNITPMSVQHQNGRTSMRQWILAGTGMVLGAIAGGVGAAYWFDNPRRPTRKQAQAVRLSERLAMIETELGPVKKIKQYADEARTHQRIDELEHQIRSTATTMRAQARGEPRWMAKLADKIRGN